MLSLVWGATLLGCNRGKEVEKLLADASKSYENLGPGLAQVRSVLSELQKGADGLAAQVPRGAEWRGKVFALAEVIGVLDAKIKWWLPEELTAARNARKQERAVQVRDEIVLVAREVEQASKVAVDLTHEKSRLERQAALLAPATKEVEAAKPEPAKQAHP